MFRQGSPKLLARCADMVARRETERRGRALWPSALGVRARRRRPGARERQRGRAGARARGRAQVRALGLSRTSAKTPPPALHSARSCGNWRSLARPAHKKTLAWWTIAAECALWSAMPKPTAVSGRSPSAGRSPASSRSAAISNHRQCITARSCGNVTLPKTSDSSWSSAARPHHAIAQQSHAASARIRPAAAGPGVLKAAPTHLDSPLPRGVEIWANGRSSGPVVVEHHDRAR